MNSTPMSDEKPKGYVTVDELAGPAKGTAEPLPERGQTPERPATAAELSLYLIMILPDETERRTYIKDFCRLYEIRERRTNPEGFNTPPSAVRSGGLERITSR
jgi:hypothetical protein